MLSEEQLVFIINQLFDAEKKCGDKPEFISVAKNLGRIKGILESSAFYVHSPLGEVYNETRTDCEATILGDPDKGLVINEVLKPLIINKDTNTIIQKALVIAG